MNAEVETAQIPGFPDYTFTKDGRVFKNGVPKFISYKKGRSAKIIIRRSKKMYTFGFAKLIATAFIPNPYNYKKIGFKDRNHHNCKIENIVWLSHTNWGLYSRAKSKTEKKVKAKPKPVSFCPPVVYGCEIKPIVGFPEYHVTSDGRVFRKGKLNKNYYSKCVKVKISGRGVSIGKLIATHFIPNPNNYRFFIYNDKNNKNCTVDNISWVSNSKYISYAIGDKVFKPVKKIASEKKKYIRKKKPSVLQGTPDVQNIRIAELIDYDLPGIYITSDGRVFKGSKQINVRIRKTKAPQLVIQRNHKKYYFGFGKLIATYFVSNPWRHSNIIFKDRNNKNCNADNLAWVDGEVFLEYACGSSWRQGGKKIVLDQEYAMRNCKDDDLRAYYKTLDENWLQACWEKIEKAYVKFFWWDSIRSECYLYFIDRAKRFSIIAPAKAMLWYYAKGQRLKLQQEISPDIPYGKIVLTDESLRKDKFKSFRGGVTYEEW